MYSRYLVCLAKRHAGRQYQDCFLDLVGVCMICVESGVVEMIIFSPYLTPNPLISDTPDVLQYTTIRSI